MQRARTLTGLFLQVLRQRWSALGKGGRVLVVSITVLATAAAAHFAFGGCAGGPCQLESSPCHSSPGHEAAARSDEPCPFAARRAAEGAPASAR